MCSMRSVMTKPPTMLLNEAATATRPRIVDSLEILAHLVHPEMFAAPSLPAAFSVVDLATVPAVL